MIKFYLKAQKNDLDISLLRAIFMSMRNTASSQLLDNYLIWRKYQSDLTIDDMEAYYLSGVNLEKISEALKICRTHKLDVKIKDLAAISLSGKDVAETIKSSMNSHKIYLNFRLSDLHISVSIDCEFRRKIGIISIEKSKIEKEIEKKVIAFISENKDLNSDQLERLLGKDVIGHEYWLKEYHSELLNQRIEINNWH